MFKNSTHNRKIEHKAGEDITEAQSSNIIAGGKVSAQAGSGKIVGSNVSAEQSVTLISDTGNFNILAAKTTTQVYAHEKVMSVGAGDLGKAMTRPDEMVKHENGRSTVKVADAKFYFVDSKSTDRVKRTAAGFEGW